MASPAHTSDSRLRKRFHLARLIVDGENAGQPLAASEVRDLLGVSRKTHTRDIERAREALTFEERAPKKRGPKPGRRVAEDVIAMAVDLVYPTASSRHGERSASRRP